MGTETEVVGVKLKGLFWEDSPGLCDRPEMYLEHYMGMWVRLTRPGNPPAVVKVLGAVEGTAKFATGETEFGIHMDCVNEAGDRFFVPEKHARQCTLEIWRGE